MEFGLCNLSNYEQSRRAGAYCKRARCATIVLFYAICPYHCAGNVRFERLKVSGAQIRTLLSRPREKALGQARLPAVSRGSPTRICMRLHCLPFSHLLAASFIMTYATSDVISSGRLLSVPGLTMSSLLYALAPVSAAHPVVGLYGTNHVRRILTPFCEKSDHLGCTEWRPQGLLSSATASIQGSRG
ncbi:hypothetical protein OBBRIDRAFT_440838 [Obba rivulosa]|uniref:Uncharacterized protein n=1 Tax=Obba rivulosa TaxID=1052685 RepID=A0A8E2DUJ8_9APHY|nr:hypothetical protein OBBRIDRAFT_440838 [Obba rivulosa]